MPVIEQRVNINRSVTDIFRFMTDFGNNPRWQSSGTKLERVNAATLALYAQLLAARESRLRN